MTESEWRLHIRRRRENSEFWQLIHMLGSLHLAMVLLLTIPIACAIATIYESRFDAQVAQAYIYKAPWFLVWLGVLCINLFAVTLTRWPWQRKHFGFVITHYGIITILAGGVIGQYWGFEGSISLHVNNEPTRQLVINRTILQMESGMEGIAYKTPFPVVVSPPSPEKPRVIDIPHSPLKIKVEEYSEKLGEEANLIDSPIPDSGAGISLEASSAMMGQSTALTLARTPATAAANEFFGMAQIEWTEALPDRSAAKPLPGSFREAQMVFANSAPIATSHSGEPSGYRLGLIVEEHKVYLFIESASNHREVHELGTIIGKPLTLHNGTTQVIVREYWPDMVLEEGIPTSKSADPNNPAALVHLSSDGTRERPLLEIAPDGNGGIAWQVSRAGVVSRQGKTAVGEAFETGWADWKFTLRDFKANAIVETLMLPREDAVLTPGSRELISGIRARLIDPSRRDDPAAVGEDQWVPSGRGTRLHLGQRTVFLGFGLEVHNMPFTLKLLKFEVPRQQGSDAPADYMSTVRFEENGQTTDALIHMNFPASYPQDWWRPWVGAHYKFSQAQWNPQDLGETTLQVLYDPGWLLKWVGSLLMCLGITIMFYLKPKPSPAKKGKRPAGPPPIPLHT